MHIGWSRFRSAAAPISVVGVVGTFLTVAATAVLLHLAFGLAWYVALLVATEVAPTDPAVVFSVLGQREVSGRAGTILEGESGANDPAGIALMASLVAAGGVGAAAFAHAGGEFLLQIVVGAAVGVAGGRALLWSPPGTAAQRGPVPAADADLRAAAVRRRHPGPRVRVPGGLRRRIALGDERAPFKREIEHFHTALASLAEIVAFVALGLTINLAVIARADVWVPGVIVGAVVAFLIRPVLVGLCLVPARLKGNVAYLRPVRWA